MNNLDLQTEKAYLEKIRKIAENPILQDYEYAICERDPYYWLTTYAYTIDQHDQLFPIKRFPDKEYVKHYVDCWFKYELLLCLKSRQIMASWISMALLLWEIQFRKGRFCFAQSKKEDDADSLIERAYFIYQNQPKWIRRKEMKYTYCRLRCPDNASVIMGIPQGGDQIRMHTASRVFLDEMAFQDEAEKSLVASKPTIDGGGAFVGISTAEPSFFQTLVDFKAPEQELMTGVSLKTNDIGFKVLKFHYTADPDKRDPEWIRKAKKGTTAAGWAKEMEMDFNAFSGELALPEIKDKKKEIYIDPIEIPEWWPKYGGLDYGYRNPFAFYNYTIDSEGCIYVYFEHYFKERPLKWHADKIKSHEDFVKLDYIVIDPSTTAMTQQGEDGGVRSIWDRLVDLGIDNLLAGQRAEIKALEIIRQLILDGKLKISKSCPNLMWELERLRFVDMTDSQLRDKNLKEKLIDKDNHGWDCLKYFVLSLPDNAEKKEGDRTSTIWQAIRKRLGRSNPEPEGPIDPVTEQLESKGGDDYSVEN